MSLCLCCKVNEVLETGYSLCPDCKADHPHPHPRKPEEGSDEWYEMMDNPKSAWRAGE